MIMILMLGTCTVLGGIAALWFFWDKIVVFVARHHYRPVMPVNRKLAEEIGLEKFVVSQGYHLSWGATKERDYYFRFGDYEPIMWTDENGKIWELGPFPDGELPMMTKFSPDEIQKRRNDRKRNK